MNWRWRCIWGTITLAIIALIMSNTVPNKWLLKPSPCTSELPPGDTATVITVEDDPIARLNLRLGRWDSSRSYKMFDYATVGDRYAESSANHRVCLATQSSIERLHELITITEHWSGPISVAVFVAGDEMRLLRAFVMWLIRCRPEDYARLALHLATPVEQPGQQGDMPQWAKNCEIDLLPHLEKRGDTAWGERHLYPQNHLRNLARRNCHTPFVFLVDVDIVPSKGMAEALDTFLATSPKCSMCAYVVPTYEIDKRVAKIPESKSELLQLTKNGLAVAFHRMYFIYNQYSSNLSRWESSCGNESADTHISHSVTNYYLYYEPFYVASDIVPAHDERFTGYGFTRNTQVYEMFLMGYQFKVLSPIFTIHRGIQLQRRRPPWREKQNDENRIRFQTFKWELFARYRKDPLNLLRRPAKNFTTTRRKYKNSGLHKI